MDKYAVIDTADHTKAKCWKEYDLMQIDLKHSHDPQSCLFLCKCIVCSVIHMSRMTIIMMQSWDDIIGNLQKANPFYCGKSV